MGSGKMSDVGLQRPGSSLLLHALLCPEGGSQCSVALAQIKQSKSLIMPGLATVGTEGELRWHTRTETPGEFGEAMCNYRSWSLARMLKLTNCLLQKRGGNLSRWDWSRSQLYSPDPMAAGVRVCWSSTPSTNRGQESVDCLLG